MPGTKALDEHYKALSDEELLKLAAGGGFTEEAERVLGNELARRNFTFDEARRHFAPQWLDKADVGKIGVLVLENGERITAEVAGLNEESDQLSVTVIPSQSFTRNGHPSRRSHREIPFHKIVSFEPQPHLLEQWPFSDPCRNSKTSPPRFLFLSTVFLCMTIGSIPLFLLLISKPFGFQEASIIAYTLWVVFFTFATTGSRGGGNVPGYKFTCPVIKSQAPHLLWRHTCFLVALFTLQTAMLAARPHLPVWWNVPDRKGMTPCGAALFLLCFALLWTQILSNRSLLNRAHREFSPSQSA